MADVHASALERVGELCLRFGDLEAKISASGMDG